MAETIRAWFEHEGDLVEETLLLLQSAEKGYKVRKLLQDGQLSGFLHVWGERGRRPFSAEAKEGLASLFKKVRPVFPSFPFRLLHIWAGGTGRNYPWNSSSPPTSSVLVLGAVHGQPPLYFAHYRRASLGTWGNVRGGIFEVYRRPLVIVEEPGQEASALRIKGALDRLGQDLLSLLPPVNLSFGVPFWKEKDWMNTLAGVVQKGHAFFPYNLLGEAEGMILGGVYFPLDPPLEGPRVRSKRNGELVKLLHARGLLRAVPLPLFRRILAGAGTPEEVEKTVRDALLVESL